MGAAESVVGERSNDVGAGVGAFKVFAQNTGRCVEEPLGEGEIALNLGSGKIRWPGWISVDGNDLAEVKADLLALPFADGYADRVAAVHVLEHFYYWDAPKFLAECKRVLKPGGRIILELPCMDKVFSHIGIRLRKGEQPAPTFSWLPLWGDPRYEDPAMCHKWGYFKADMHRVLTDAGFVDVKGEEPRYHFPTRDMRATATKP